MVQDVVGLNCIQDQDIGADWSVDLVVSPTSTSNFDNRLNFQHPPPTPIRDKSQLVG